MKLRGCVITSARPFTSHLRFVPVTIGRRWLQTSIASDRLFEYTSGRWLWNEQDQRRARYRHFDVPGLQQAVCQAVGADRCVSLKKIGEGNYNKAYRLTTGDGQKVVAKIPHPNAGPPSLTTASEVATMEFVRIVLDVPAPKVLAWNASCHNPVGAEYIIMEEAKGSPLHEIWQDLPLRAKCDVVSQIVDIERKLLLVSFDKIGSLYFRDSGIPGCEPVGLVTDAEEVVVDAISSRFCVGPIARRDFWEKERSAMHRYHGPWSSPSEYMEALVDRETEWIETFAQPQEASFRPWQYTSPSQSSPEAHLVSLRRLRSTIPYITPQDPEVASIRMWHPDFHAGNIFLDASGQVSNVVDWQGAWTTPLFIGANPPSLLDYGVDMLMKLPDDFKSLDQATKDRLRYRVSQSILIHTYESLTSAKNPVMYKMMRYPHGQTLKQIEAFAGSTWDTCLYPLQECLIRIEKEWRYFGSDEPCPYRFDEEEIKRHYEEADFFNQSQSFWEEMRGIMTDDGYTSNETFNKAVDVLQDLRSAGLARLEGEERDEFDRESCWIQDIPAQI